jgi:hypothetical protein
MGLLLGTNVVTVDGGPRQMPVTARSWSEGVDNSSSNRGLAQDLRRGPLPARYRRLRASARPLAAESVSEIVKVEAAPARQAVQVPAMVAEPQWESDLFPPISFRRVGISGKIAAIGAA